MKTAINSMAFLGMSLLTLCGVHAASTITAWTFNNDAAAAPTYNPAPSTGAGTAISIGIGIYPTPGLGSNDPDVVLGKTSDTGANGVADTSNVWRIRAQGGTGTNAANGWSSAAPIGTQGAEFSVSTSGYTNISISFDWYVTTQGEANLQFRYTTDGSNWLNAPLALDGSDTGLQLITNTGITDTNTVTGSYVSDSILNPGESATAGQDWFTGLTATITNSNAANDPNFVFELVNASTGVDCISSQGTNLNNTSGNWRFDDVTVSGTSAVPEPSSYALFIGGTVVLAGFMIRRRFARS